MKILIGLLAIFLFVQTPVKAEVFVYSDKNSKEIIFIVENDTVVISSDDETRINRSVLPHDIEFYGLTEAYTDYKFINDRFILNTQKISDRENRKTQDIADGQARRIALDSAKTKLIGLGLTPAEASALTQ